MLFRETGVSEAFEIAPELRCDERGFFARTWCRKEFAAQGFDSRLEQCSISFNSRKGTLRGIHGSVLTCLGDTGGFHYKKSRCGDAAIESGGRTRFGALRRATGHI